MYIHTLETMGPVTACGPHGKKLVWPARLILNCHLIQIFFHKTQNLPIILFGAKMTTYFFCYLLFSKLCQHNPSGPNRRLLPIYVSTSVETMQTCDPSEILRQESPMLYGNLQNMSSYRYVNGQVQSLHYCAFLSGLLLQLPQIFTLTIAG